jgi:hypothetical protein
VPTPEDLWSLEHQDRGSERGRKALLVDEAASAGV